MWTLMLAWLAAAETSCPERSDDISPTTRCTDAESRLHGMMLYEFRGALYQVSFEHGAPRSITHDKTGRRTADLRTGRLLWHEVDGPNGSRFFWPAANVAGLKWRDATGRVVRIERRWGWRARNLRVLSFEADGERLVEDYRQDGVPDAHYRGHWTDTLTSRRNHGQWRVRLRDGAIETGQWRRGAPVGTWRVVAPDGREVERGAYQRGYAEGPWRCEAVDGAVLSGRYAEGLRIGDWERRDAQGRLIETFEYGENVDGEPLQGRGWSAWGERIPSACGVDPNSERTWIEAQRGGE